VQYFYLKMDLQPPSETESVSLYRFGGMWKPAAVAGQMSDSRVR
jgi:hypothetical protein